MPESDLYPIVRRWIDAEFSLVRSSAGKPRRKSLLTATLDWIDGGEYMRPDLALVHVHRRRFDPAPTLDLYTFEIKSTATRALAGLHQTLAHARIGDFVLFVAPDSKSIEPDILPQAEKFGVGVITFPPVEHLDQLTFTELRLRSPPSRQTPDADLRDEFIFRALRAADADYDPRATQDVLGWLGNSP